MRGVTFRRAIHQKADPSVALVDRLEETPEIVTVALKSADAIEDVIGREAGTILTDLKAKDMPLCQIHQAVGGAIGRTI